METLRYLVASSLYAGVCWLIYFALLRNRPAHRASRAFLLLALVLPGVLPLIRLPAVIVASPGALAFTLPEFRADSAARPASMDIATWITAVYIAGVMVMALVYTIGYFRLDRSLRSKPAELRNGYLLIRETSIGPGTLGRRIFLPGSQIDASVLAHELAHIRCGHRFDLVLLLMSRCLFWISPAHWLLGRELKIVHEFEADAIAAAGIPQQRYTNLLLQLQFGLTRGPLASHAFFHHPLKRRVMMLQRKTRGRATIAAAAFILAAGFATTVVLAQSGKAVVASVNTPRTPLDPQALRNNYMQPQPGTVGTTADGRIVLTKVDQMPQFDGNLYKWLTANVRSPEKDINGKCIVQFTVDAAGNVSFPVLTQSSNNPRLDAEALRLVRAMPKWKPGVQNGVTVAVLYTLPFLFGHLGEGC